MPNAVTLEQLADQLADGARRLGDLTPVMREIARAVSADLYERVAEGTSPSGEAFAPLRKERKSGGLLAGTPLAGGALHESLRGGPYHVEEVTPTGFSVGTTHPLSEIHQRGAVIRRPEQRRRPPQKPFVFETDAGQVVFSYRIAPTTIVIPAREHVGFSLTAINKCEDLLAAFTASAVTGEQP